MEDTIMKKLIATALTGVMIFGVCACGKTDPVATEASATTTEATTTTTTSETTVETTTETTANPFTNDDYALFGNLDSGFSDFDWHDASLEVAEDPEIGVSYPKRPNYAAGQDAVFSFKCTGGVYFGCAAKITPAAANAGYQDIDIYASCMPTGTPIDGITNILDDCTLTEADGVYTVTIPGSLVETGHSYFIMLQNKENNTMLFMSVRCE